MDPIQSSPPSPSHGFPRTRGDGPGFQQAAAGARLFPPHARGMDLRDTIKGCVIGGFPRTRGDGPDLDAATPHFGEFPPHARGWTQDRPAAVPWVGVSPARAGMDRRSRSDSSDRWRFPRTRGDGTGALIRRAHTLIVSPARAGMDPPSHQGSRSRCGFPRTRGDGPRLETHA